MTPERTSTPALLTESYDYTLPPELIATEAAEPRDSARLMVIDRRSGEIHHTVFREILSFLPEECGVIYNDTKVIKARLFGQKASGGKVELLINKPLDATTYNVLIRGRVREGTRLTFAEDLQAEVLACYADGSRRVRFLNRDGAILSFEALLPRLERYGHVPLPPYMQRADTEKDATRYQPVFAHKEGAVAAPTASLHFTEPLFEALKRRHATGSVTLHVGAGTFKPVETDLITDHPMHSEWYEIPEATRKMIDTPGALLAIGTTVTRTVEYYVRTGKTRGECDLFLHPGNPPRRIDHLLTNFHLPKSTLIMLVASFLGLEETMKVYNRAIEARYRFYSYGDAMLIL
ncbi:tRNA preQ1(34) S-adenosylmethionine ribosyltransferase-isomerase QueA [Hydrogenimonas sp. SS33]|uniref:tRNA preQ1(34) S-adenosylmethionine ribosyltransferase-isomerase QueA n=1 Tax=Hydrogenimonas leucolamina TaxID=2954236 RepID=UPI00336BF83B